MKHNIDDTVIQSAIDAAFTSQSVLELNSVYRESPARFALACAFLELLPEPLPPVVDGKTPGELLFELIAIGKSWMDCIFRDKWEAAASAVLAAFGGQVILDAAIARMESVPIDGLWVSFNENGGVGYDNSLKAVRDHLIAAAKGDGEPVGINGLTASEEAKTASVAGLSQPAETPWIEWHGGECPLKDEEVEEWEFKRRDGVSNIDTCTPSTRRWSHKESYYNDKLDIIAYRVLKWREGCGPDAVDWRARVEKVEKAAISFAEIGHGLREELKMAEAKAEKAEEEAATERRKRLYAEEHLGVLAKTFGYEGRTWSNMVSYLCPRLLKAEAELTRSAETLDYVCDTLDAMDIPSVTGESSLSVEQRLDLALRKLEKSEAELARVRHIYDSRIIEESEQPQLSRLRPIAEAGPVPEGAVRWYCYFLMGLCYMGNKLSSQDTHFIDIYPPKASQPAVGAEQVWADQACKALVEHAEQVAKPEPATFEAHGKTWTRHTPGDPMPCELNRSVDIITQKAIDEKNWYSCPHDSAYWNWNNSTKIIGWRYADDPTPEPLGAKPWTPAVGDKVKLKGGSFTMTVEQADSDGIACEWHDSNGVPQARTYTPETLQPA